MLLIGCQKEHPACKNWVMRCWCGYFSGARCRLFAYGPADATAIPKPNHLLLHLNPVLLYWYWLTQVVPENGSLNACNIGMSILCEYAIATYFSHCRIFCIFQQTAHIAYFFPHGLAFFDDNFNILYVSVWSNNVWSTSVLGVMRKFLLNCLQKLAQFNVLSEYTLGD